MTNTTTLIPAILDNNGLFFYCIYRGHVIIKIASRCRTGESMYLIYDTGSTEPGSADQLEVAMKLHRNFDYCEFDECSFAGAMQRVDKWA